MTSARREDPSRPRGAEAGPSLVGLAAGIVLVALGVTLLGERLGIVDLDLPLWPLLVVAFGVVKLFDPAKRGAGIWITSAGLWLFFGALDPWGLGLDDSWPLLLVFGGLGLLLAALFEGSRGEEGSP